ncbi:hypothetical protein G4G27_14925 [Sphingomonas sp. So64.6b]|uniref:hypothetical protein n=1 Tax=Sphingomonas sp. So64.6b TaxID=2997354 RepID=UPI0016032F71|nr:hypothetical protein [Sphingomonas sp. So64.6b]QNA85145.1 hypothetical protein G4G27_14925 [Sphingomonas sp. So64.6b]
MCPPALAIPLAIASTVMATGGAIMSGIGQAQQYRYQASIADQNNRLANEQAKDSIENTNLEAQRRGRALAQIKGAQQAAMAANGVDLNFGSAVDVQKDTAMIGAEDLAQIYKGGNQRTRGFEISAFNYRSEAAANRAKASGALINAGFSAVSTALGGASNVSVMKKQGY